MIKKAMAALIAAVIIACGSSSAWAIEKGDKSVGIRAGFSSSNTSGVAGLYFRYAFSSRFRLAPDVDYTFRHKGMDAFSIDLNAHVPVTPAASRLTVYPLAGINYTSWNQHGTPADPSLDYNDVTTRVDRLGINAGAGADYAVTPTLRLGFEGKYRWTRNRSSCVLTVSIGYAF